MSDDDVWVSPVDRHFHYGDAGRAECAVCCLEAERDHWRVLARREAAEHDRLRVVVEKTADTLAIVLDHLADDMSDDVRDLLAEAQNRVVATERVEVDAVTAERDRLRAVVDAVREWNRARGRLLIADTTEDEDRATDALDVAGQEVLSLLAALDVSPTGEDA